MEVWFVKKKEKEYRHKKKIVKFDGKWYPKIVVILKLVSIKTHFISKI